MPKVYPKRRWWYVQIDDDPYVIPAAQSFDAVQAAMKRAAYSRKLPTAALIGYEEVTSKKQTDDSGPCVEARIKMARKAGTPRQREIWGDKVARCEAARDRRREQWKREAAKVR